MDRYAARNEEILLIDVFCALSSHSPFGDITKYLMKVNSICADEAGWLFRHLTQQEVAPQLSRQRERNGERL